MKRSEQIVELMDDDNNARTNTAGGNDYYESAVVNPDIVLRDLVKIFHPELVQEECVYYKQLK